MGFLSARIVEKFKLDPFYAELVKAMIIYLSAVSLVMVCHKLFGLKYSTVAGQEQTYQQICHSLNKCNVLAMDQVELPFNIQTCPRKNTRDWVVCKIKNIDQAMDEHFEEFGKLPELTKEQQHFVIAITNIYKHFESLHHLSLTRQYELSHKRARNGFLSNAAYYKACQKAPRRTRIFLKYVEDVGESWGQFENEHGIPTPTNGCLFIYAKIPSANSSLKDPGGFHHCMLALSKNQSDAMGPSYMGSLRHLLAYRCANYKGE